jgi:hypothetical protein
MRVIEEEARQTAIAAECDVLVAGGGIAGIAAAVAAARNGAKVLLMEREYTLGGLATLGLITIYLPLCDGRGHQLVHGLGEELLRLSIKHGAERNYPSAWLDGGGIEERIEKRFTTQFNPHLFAIEAESLLLSLGVRILYGTVAVVQSWKTASFAPSLRRISPDERHLRPDPSSIAPETQTYANFRERPRRCMPRKTASPVGIITFPKAR